MKIGIDCRTILNPQGGEKAGVGHYTYFLINSLLEIDKKNKYVLFFDNRIFKEAVEKFNRENVKIRFFPDYKYKKFLPIIYSHFLIARFIKKEKLDLFHSPTNTLPLGYNGKSVITVHDLAIYKQPEWFPSGILTNKFSKKIVVPKSIKKADKIIAISESTKKDIIDIFKVSEEKIEVVYPGGGSVLWPESSFYQDPSSKYILFLGTIEPRKNILGLIDAFLKVDDKNLKLVIAGVKGWKCEGIFDKINKNKDRIKYLGYISDSQKQSLFLEAKAFVFPSLYEGFGLPVLEAMSLGVPVIASNTSSLPEVVGDAGILVNPKDTEKLTDAIKKVVSDEQLRNKLRIRGLEQANKFSWVNCVEQILNVYQKL